jgi:hypothetical protein
MGKRIDQVVKRRIFGIPKARWNEAAFGRPGLEVLKPLKLEMQYVDLMGLGQDIEYEVQPIGHGMACPIRGGYNQHSHVTCRR